MDEGYPFIQPLRRCAKEFQEALIHELDVTDGIERVDHGRNTLEDEAEITFAPPQLLFGTSLIVDVGEQTVPSDDAAAIVQKGIHTDVDPAVDPIEALQAVIELQRLPECATAKPLDRHQLSLVRVNEVETVEPYEFINGRPCEIEKTSVGVFLLAR